MQEHLLKIDFRTVDLSSLEPEDDFHREAKRLLPEALVQLGEAVGKKYDKMSLSRKCAFVEPRANKA